MKESLVDNLLGIPDADKAINYGFAIWNALRHAGKDMNTQQRIITNIFEDL